MDILKTLLKRFFRHEAHLVLLKYKPKIIAITGSVGKTTTREALYQVLSKKFSVRKNEKSFTAELGVPLAIIGCADGSPSLVQWIKNIFQGLKLLAYKNRYPEYIILEIDSDKPGDLRKVSSFLSPDILVVTAIGETPAHIEMFPGIEEFLSEKRSLISAMKRDALVVYNMDDTRASNLVRNIVSPKVSCGIGRGANVHGTDFQILYGSGRHGQVPTGMSFDIKEKRKTYSVTIFDSIGIHNEYASLLAFAVGRHLGMEAGDIINALSKYKSLPGRMNVMKGIKDTVIIDDSYNASPIAMEQALIVFKDLKSEGRKIAVLGDMLELGRFSGEEHKKLAILVRDTASIVMCVGIRARKISEELLNLGFEEGGVFSFDTAEEAGKELQTMLTPGDSILIKGSQVMRMEKVVEEIMRYPEDKGKLLPRQSAEWIGR